MVNKSHTEGRNIYSQCPSQKIAKSKPEEHRQSHLPPILGLGTL